MTGRSLPKSSLILMSALRGKDSLSRALPAASGGSGEELPEARPVRGLCEPLEIEPAGEALAVTEPAREQQVADVAQRHELHPDLLRGLQPLPHRLEVFAQVEMAD